jgi:hypothetical protein
MKNDPTDVDPTIGRWVKPGHIADTGTAYIGAVMDYNARMNRMAVKPISPQEALDAKITTIPDFVIDAVNAMLAEKMTKHGRITLLQKDICDRICATNPGVHKSQIYNSGWLDFEPFYEKAGWNVKYDSPAYCESYEPSFDFSKR